MLHVWSITDAPLDGSGLARIWIITRPHSSLNNPTEISHRMAKEKESESL